MTAGLEVKNGINQVVQLMGTNVQLEDLAGGIRPIRAAITSIGKEDGALINAVGIEGRIVYALPLTPDPLKFHTITTPTGKVYTIHDIHEILVDGVVGGYKMICKV
jgi:hypothetical protein